MEDGWLGSPLQVLKHLSHVESISTQLVEHFPNIYVAQSVKNREINRCHVNQQAYYAHLRYVTWWQVMMAATALSKFYIKEDV
jgi:hypothetical protein